MLNVKLGSLVNDFPDLEKVMTLQEILWVNGKFNVQAGINHADESINQIAIDDAAGRLQRFAPFIANAFPETALSKGIIESEIMVINEMKSVLKSRYDVAIEGKLLLKCDNALPISGSIKARGGIYEVLKHAEKLALEAGLLSIEEPYELFASEKVRAFFSKYSIAVGSTGNLGLSIGIMSAKLGFQVTVHMSADAKEWKKALLREKGVSVVEYETDYSLAVEKGREQAESDPMCYFIDDENSKDLFLGYAVAASRLKSQLNAMNIIVDAEHPLFVYLPCGVGGGPGGVAYGLKSEFGEHVYSFFAEPTNAPCMMIGMMTGLHDGIAVEDLGIEQKTEADGLAVGRASGFVGRIMEPLLAGCYTITDDEMLTLLRELKVREDIFLEPSALAGMKGPVILEKEGQAFLAKQGLNMKMASATHIVWATGGNMVPDELQEQYLNGKY
ncbi:D-serine ammonia-lyase [Viridibacillus sp. YIM B01967]|uniref:Probable D-serine dehydratase n=1 Tax=Viridibacillus soli TaxID=2798301 RepID=A0ABS1H6M4_9BACL|nr:D-serine ammonia-lyase [Viridibacillus soli]MBK3494954.1 D-serine ammonia-lyase [Viridibacillus soli]